MTNGIAHFVIVGFGEVGQELAIQVAQLAHYENLKRARMTIVYDKSDAEAVQHFQELYPKYLSRFRTRSSNELKAVRGLIRPSITYGNRLLSLTNGHLVCPSQTKISF
jgi:hypothetical protein